MTSSLIKALENLSAIATPAPWFVRPLRDDAGVHAVTVVLAPDAGETDADRSDKVVAACPVRSSRDTTAGYGNADLIVELRNALPELVRLAKLGLRAERGQAGR